MRDIRDNVKAMRYDKAAVLEIQDLLQSAITVDFHSRRTIKLRPKQLIFRAMHQARSRAAEKSRGTPAAGGGGPGAGAGAANSKGRAGSKPRGAGGQGGGRQQHRGSGAGRATMGGAMEPEVGAALSSVLRSSFGGGR